MSKINEASLLTVIIPIGVGDKAWRELLPLLEKLPKATQIIFSATSLQFKDEIVGSRHLGLFNVKFIEGPKGRAGQMNRAAQEAHGKYLWFLHADSRFEQDAIDVLVARLSAPPEALFYFKLKFSESQNSVVSLNAHGANLRSKFLKMPFGDQGFCLSRELFFRLGGYDENAPYGEDHLLVWAARHAKVQIVDLPAWIATSARKYEVNGWTRTTLKHVWLTTKQATPQFLQLFRSFL